METGATDTETAAESYECEICGQTFDSAPAWAAHRGQSHTTAERRAVLIDALDELADELGSTPTTREMDKHGKYSKKVYQNLFGSWNNALREAGLEPNYVTGGANTETLSYGPDWHSSESVLSRVTFVAAVFVSVQPSHSVMAFRYTTSRLPVRSEPTTTTARPTTKR